MNSIEQLKGKTILIGKEPVNGRLLVSVKINEKTQTAALGVPNSVPNTVSRCKPAEDAAHCKIVVDNAGTLTVTNLKPENVTYINGMEIVSKKIAPDGTLQLGRDKYPVSVATVIETAAKIVAAAFPPPPEEYSILPLKAVWDDYNTKMRNIKIRQKNIGLLASLPMAFSMLGGIVAGVATDELRKYALGFTLFAFLVFMVGLYKRFTDHSIEEMEKITEDFQRKYVCPNDKKPCLHFMGNVPYNILRQNTRCPYCGCSFTEK